MSESSWNFAFPQKKMVAPTNPKMENQFFNQILRLFFFGTDEPTWLLILKQPGYSLWDVAGFIQEHGLPQNWEIFFDLLWLAVHFIQNYTPE